MQTPKNNTQTPGLFSALWGVGCNRRLGMNP